MNYMPTKDSAVDSLAEVKPGVEITDLELVVLGEIIADLSRVDCFARNRLVRYLADRYGPVQ